MRSVLSTEARTALAHLAKADKLMTEVNIITERLQAKAEQHLMAAALIFKKIKVAHDTKRYGPWKVACEKKCGLSWQRVYELINIADGQQTIDDQRKRTRKRVAASRAKNGLLQDQCNRPNTPGFFEPVEPDADPRIFYRSRLVNLMLDAERSGQEHLNPEMAVYDFAQLASDAEQVADTWREVAETYRGLAKHERQHTLPKQSAA